MHVEHLDAALVRDRRERIAAARRAASLAMPESRGDADDAGYWQELFERTAAAVLAALPEVRLAAGHVVRYRFCGRRGSDLLVRPFVARAGTDVRAVRHVLDWHASPDSGVADAAAQDVELLYRHFTIAPGAAGAFDYWLAMQELWASQRWIHATVLADAAEFSQLTAAPDWRVERPVERVEPAIVLGGADIAQLAVLVHHPLERHAVVFHRIRITPTQAIEYAESLIVAAGPRGLLI